MSEIANNILTEMQKTPAFRPTNIKMFGDWSYEPGDVINVETDTGTEIVPIFGNTLTWLGTAESQIGATGNLERKQTKNDRDKFRQEDHVARGFGGAKKDVEEVREAYNGLSASVDKNTAALALSVKELEDYKEAAARMYVTLDGVRAEIGAYAFTQGGVTKTLAQILADFTRITGRLSVGDDVSIIGNTVLGGKLGVDGLVTCSDGLRITGGDLVLGTDIYRPTSITSSAGRNYSALARQ